jgi:quercetin dioxygenase-like cupin family protein
MLFRIAGAGIGVLLTVLVALPQSAVAQEAMSNPAMRAVANADLNWEDVEVPGFLPGMQLTPIHGDPSVADQPYTLRLAFPDGYRFPPHWHPRAENVTVLEGEFLLEMGEEFDEASLKTYKPGDYLFIEAENSHYGAAKGRTVIQLHGMGPFEINVVEGQEMTN